MVICRSCASHKALAQRLLNPTAHSIRHMARPQPQACVHSHRSPHAPNTEENNQHVVSVVGAAVVSAGLR